MALPATTLRVVMKQLQEVCANPIEGIALRPTEDVSEIEAEIKGPEDTPFHNGTFVVSLVVGESYPDAPPKGFFKTKIFHPNVSEKGEICVNTLKKDWEATLGLRHVLTVIRCLLIEPNPESALNEEAGMLLLEDYQEYYKRAKMMTSVHAMPLRDVESTNSVPAPTADKKAIDKKRAMLKRL